MPQRLRLPVDVRRKGSVGNEAVFPLLKKALIERTGLSYYEDKDKDLAQIVDVRMEELNLPDGTGYLQLLNGGSGEQELHLIVTKLTIGETYFFRHEEQFAALRDLVLPAILARNQDRHTLRIWSAGCASGAEPYSVSILLRRDLAHLTAGWDIQILGSDINSDFLDIAKAGIYGQWALRSVPDDIRQQCFTEQGGRWEIAARFRTGVEFRQHNLVSGPPPMMPRPDLILCRNVMIYFDQETIAQLATQFYDALPDWGWLVVGHAETNIDHFARFETRNAPGTTFYQKLPAEHGTFLNEAPVYPALTGLLPKLPLPNLPSSNLPLSNPEVPRAALPYLRTAAESRWPEVGSLIAADKWEQARLLSDTLLGLDPIVPLGHYLRALIFDHADLPEEAERSLRKSIYLDRAFAASHYGLGTLLERRGDDRGAIRSYETTLRILAAAEPDTEPIPLSTIVASALTEMLQEKLEAIRTV